MNAHIITFHSNINFIHTCLINLLKNVLFEHVNIYITIKVEILEAFIKNKHPINNHQ